MPGELRQTLEEQFQSYHQIQPITAAMHKILRQVLQCPYEGLLKRLYLQGKALELMSLQFEQLQRQQQRLESLQRSELEQIHDARDLLLQQMADPPSLLELARSVGLNDFALKQGFRRVFGTTVFRYLHEQRLVVARQLLMEQPDLTVQEVCEQVGFANRGYFAAAFRKQFGMNPKQYRLAGKLRVSDQKDSLE